MSSNHQLKSGVERFLFFINRKCFSNLCIKILEKTLGHELIEKEVELL